MHETDDLIRALCRALGAEAVVTARAARATYECDGYTLERAIPPLVVLPRTAAEAVETLAALDAAGAAFVPRGAGTSLAGGCLAGDNQVVVSLARLNRIEALDPVERTACVEAGVVNLRLTEQAAAHGLMFAPDPSSQSVCTIGGNVANNSGGPHTLKVGVTVNHVLAVDLARPGGARGWVGSEIPMQGGPDLTGLVVGNEGTFGLTLRAWVRLVPAPESVRTVLASFASVEAASHAVTAVVRSGILPAAVEMMDALVLEALARAFDMHFPEGAAAVLILEVDGPEEGLEEDAHLMERCCIDAGATDVTRATDPGERARLWSARKRAFGALGRLARDYCTQDGVVPRTALPQVLQRIQVIGERHGLRIANVFHAGDGNLHPVLMYDPEDAAEVERVFRASEEILEACLECGGSLTGEHGIGIEKRELMARAFDPTTLEVMRRVRAVFDPDGRANPDKIFPSGSGCSDAPRLLRSTPGRRAPQ